jgi:hypothetical protein
VLQLHQLVGVIAYRHQLARSIEERLARSAQQVVTKAGSKITSLR